jgi:hypothetical protein
MMNRYLLVALVIGWAAAIIHKAFGALPQQEQDAFAEDPR